MNVRCSFKNVSNSQILSEYIEQKISEIILKYIHKEVSIDITFLSNGSENRVHCRLNGGEFFNIGAEGISPSMSEAIEMMLSRLGHQASKRKDLVKDRHRHRAKISNLLNRTSSASEDESIDAEEILKYEQKMGRLKKSA